MIEYRIISDREEKRSVIEACDHAFSNPVSQRNGYEALLTKIHNHGDFLAAYCPEPVGYLAMYANDEATKTAYITLLAVKPECQNMRIGASLLEAGLALAASRGMEQVKLEVKKDNHRAQSVYQRVGFSCLCDAGEDSIYMIKYLDKK